MQNARAQINHDASDMPMEIGKRIFQFFLRGKKKLEERKRKSCENLITEGGRKPSKFSFPVSPLLCNLKNNDSVAI